MASNSKMCLSTAIVYLGCIALTVLATTDYCNPNLCHGRAHVACKKESKKFDVDPCSDDARVLSINATEKEYIVNEINTIRNNVALGKLDGFSPASNMSVVKWDNELAYIAQMSVKKCVFHMDACRNTPTHQNVGQTSAYGAVKGKNRTLRGFVTNHIRHWFEEWQLATMKDIVRSNVDDTEPPHNFMQIVHDKVHRIGCSSLKQTRNGWTQNFFTCNYDVAPTRGQAAYETSNRPGETCVSGIHENFTALCDVSEEQKKGVPKKNIKKKNKNKNKNRNKNKNKNKNKNMDKSTKKPS